MGSATKIMPDNTKLRVNGTVNGGVKPGHVAEQKWPTLVR